MFNIIVRARKDAKAVQYVNERNYGGYLRVSSLGGGRKFEEVKDGLQDALENPYVPIFLFGEKEKELAQRISEEIKGPFFVRVLRTKRVRNMRVDELYGNIEDIKARFRLGVAWSEERRAYILDPSNPLGLEINPDYDTYLAVGEGFRRHMKELLGVEMGDVSLVLRKLMNQEVYYSGPNKIAEVSKVIGRSTEVLWRILASEEVSLDETIEGNKEYIEAFERASAAFLKGFEGDIIVPWSGGKDSTAALILASKVFKNVTAVYVRMEYEMPLTDEYVERTAKKLGVDLIKVEVPMPLERYGLPTHTNRWCTGMKVEALYDVVKDFENPILVVGDRDGESMRRRLKPPVVERKTPFGPITEVMPIKFWSGMMVQLYILMNGLDLHPLYYEGFYRLGCTVCPSLADWEIRLLSELGHLPEIMKKRINGAS
ncbi:phosphoadenosine phosphosulfate reductase domain-containing protein [Pyrococcus yayanosii]|uniref:Phosphoadenosine phosphosulfate reductase family protein n=1 Tax=Pyrococcus yayanosii (strain CH1 / JCM 16557) TaxID=529709 RepID=F8AEY1_PYRYC|nr:phosphoadenosine phosphosulfate reductase family protein [Pyrococcus yayanosii]AEH24818.1 Phosphoadenosine phosphosulfate reductase family protein [Pyrococcus yayanosii CH1]